MGVRMERNRAAIKMYRAVGRFLIYRFYPWSLYAQTIILTIASLSAALVGLAFFHEPVSFKNNPPTPGAAGVIGAAVVFALVAACTLMPSQLNVTTIASLLMALALTSAGGSVAKKFLGGFLGIVVALVFLIPITGSGNDLAVFLLGLSAFIGAFEWFALRLPAHAQTGLRPTCSRTRMVAGDLFST